jgi:uncharacterized membrane protein YcfT
MTFLILILSLISVHFIARWRLQKKLRLFLDCVIVLAFLCAALGFILPELGLKLLTSFFLPNAVARH